eukprot:Nitzschia sp. Nitz4//scaffold28_size193895//5587//8745//NITZ4_001620-RA/size193895-processed-gene-0.245-mRNA-1//-1//CDS//3329545847//4450//frame0
MDYSTRTKNSVRVLVCSGNMGNAAPDVASLNAWIPADGLVDLALSRPPKFPIVMDPRRARNPPDSTANVKRNKLPPSGEQSKRLAQPQRQGSTDSFDNFTASRKQQSFEDSLDNSHHSQSSLRSPRNSVSSIKSIQFEANFDDLDLSDHPPPPPADDESTHEEPPKRLSQSSLQMVEKFDIVVIGMQEATFSSDQSTKEKRLKSASSSGLTSEDNSLVDMDSIEDFDEEILPGWEDNGSIRVSACSVEDANDEDIDCDFDFDAVEATYVPEGAKEQSETDAAKNRKSTAGKFFGATLKAGKAGLKAGKAGYKVGKAGFSASKKVGKATVKTAKAVNTLVTAKDHTLRPKPSAQQASAPVQDGSFPGWADTDVLHYRFEDQLQGYDRALSYQLGEMRMMIYFNPQEIDLEVLSVKYKPTGAGGLANKGGIVAEVRVNESTRLSFLTAHLEAHEGEEKYQTRCTSFLDILMGTKSSVSPCKVDASLSSHYMIAMGDLNFRTRLEGVEPGSERHIKICHAMAAAKDWKMLNKHDELARALHKKHCLSGFRTPYCNFDPTFKVARQGGYQYNEKRSPSYTDRILFKTGDQLHANLRPILYEPIEDFTTSDHKPIRGAFKIKLNDELSWHPAKALPKSSKKSRSKTTEEVDTDEEVFVGETVDRETMHVFISAMQCQINGDEFDKSRKVEKAELPQTYLTFVSNPAEAVQMDSSKKSMWKKLGYGSSKGKESKTKLPSTGSKPPSSKFPSTSVLQDTLRPNWKDETLHFSVRTHLTNGSPIDLTGALLHVVLMDTKGGTVGSFPLNLARLITVSRNPRLANALASAPKNAQSMGPGGRGPSRAGGPPRQKSMPHSRNHSGGVPPNGPPNEPPIRQRSLPQRNPGRGQRGGPGPSSAGRGPAGSRGGAQRDSGQGGRAPTKGGRSAGRGDGSGWSIGPPSKALQAASCDSNGFPTPVRQVAKSLGGDAMSNSSMLERRGSLRNITTGPSASLRESIHRENGGDGAMEEKLKDMHILSLRLDEALMEGGLEVARIKCSIDVWWKIDEIPKESDDKVAGE